MAEHINPAQLSSGTRDATTPPAAVDAHTGPRKTPQPGSRVESGAVGSAPYHPSIGLDPANVKAIEGYADFEGYMAPALNAFSTAYVGLTDIANARAQAEKNQAWNDYQKLLIVAQFAEKKQEAMTKAFDKAHKDLTTAAQQLDEQLSKPLVEQAAGSINAEIRAHVKNLSTDERMKLINDAFKNGNTKVLASILGAESFLSGLGDAMHAALTRRYNERQSPEAVKRLDVTRRAIALIHERGPLVFEQVQKAMAGTWTKVRQLREADSEARKALLMQQNDVGAYDFLAGAG